MEDIEQRLVRLEQKLDATYASAEKTRKYFLGMLILAGVSFVLPLIGLMFLIPMYASILNSNFSGLL